jgi:SAM-dependent methyltransferase
VDLKTLKRNWDEFGKRDPLWAILTAPHKRNRKWDLDEFFRTGEKEIALVMQSVDSLPLTIRRGKALDFGCGVGRLTQALGGYFDRCIGVDIAPSMLRLAKRHNKLGGRCQYLLNDSSDLRLFKSGTFDFVYSNIVLQHMKPEYGLNYVKEFIRVLAPGGLIVFQLPSEPVAARPAPGKTAASGALPAAAFSARICTADAGLSARPGEVVELRVRIQNTSPATWPSLGASGDLYQIRLGNHWLNKCGQMLRHDDARADLPADLPPNGETELTLAVTAPLRSAKYFLELDLVQEGVCWFAQKGSPTARVSFDVKARGSRLSHLAETLKSFSEPLNSPPIMEMYGVKREIVTELIEKNGGRVVKVDQNQSAGDSWISFQYYATK